MPPLLRSRPPLPPSFLPRPPCRPAEAQDRAFRIGQQRDVSVYRFVASGGWVVGETKKGGVGEQMGGAAGRERHPSVNADLSLLTSPTAGTLESMIYNRQARGEVGAGGCAACSCAARGRCLPGRHRQQQAHLLSHAPTCPFAPIPTGLQGAAQQDGARGGGAATHVGGCVPSPCRCRCRYAAGCSHSGLRCHHRRRRLDAHSTFLTASPGHLPTRPRMQAPRRETSWTRASFGACTTCW